MNEVQANGGIDDINARYDTKMEGYMGTDVVYEGVVRNRGLWR